MHRALLILCKFNFFSLIQLFAKWFVLLHLNLLILIFRTWVSRMRTAECWVCANFHFSVWTKKFVNIFTCFCLSHSLSLSQLANSWFKIVISGVVIASRQVKLEQKNNNSNLIWMLRNISFGKSEILVYIHSCVFVCPRNHCKKSRKMKRNVPLSKRFLTKVKELVRDENNRFSIPVTKPNKCLPKSLVLSCFVCMCECSGNKVLPRFGGNPYQSRMLSWVDTTTTWLIGINIDE